MRESCRNIRRNGTRSYYRPFAKILVEEHTKCDEDHLRIIIDNNPKMPSRQDAIMKGTESPVAAMVATAENLKSRG